MPSISDGTEEGFHSSTDIGGIDLSSPLVVIMISRGDPSSLGHELGRPSCRRLGEKLLFWDRVDKGLSGNQQTEALFIELPPP
jgi:hypothetical protein